MNLLLISQDNILSSTRAIVRGRQAQHIIKILNCKVGDVIKTGVVNGEMGTALIQTISNGEIELSLNLLNNAPPPLPLTLILALPRPKMLRRILQSCASLGIKKIFLINSYRVEKSYWQTPWLDQQAIEEQLLLGLEQGCDPTLPQVYLRKRFKPFIEDELPELASATNNWIAHPYNSPNDNDNGYNNNQYDSILAIGPEGGFIPYEVEKFLACGFQALSLGPRILKVETAIPVAVTQLYPTLSPR